MYLFVNSLTVALIAC